MDSVQEVSHGGVGQYWFICRLISLHFPSFVATGELDQVSLELQDILCRECSNWDKILRGLAHPREAEALAIQGPNQLDMQLHCTS